jgi:hypothetical protein
MCYGSRVRLLVVPYGPIGEITGILADGWYQVIVPFAPSVHLRLHARQLIEVKITGDLHAANPRGDKFLVNCDVFSVRRPSSIRVGNRPVCQAPDSIEPKRISRQAQRLAGSAPLGYPAHGRHKLFQERSQCAILAERRLALINREVKPIREPILSIDDPMCIDLSVFGNAAAWCGENLDTGQNIVVSGRLQCHQ